MYSNTQSILQNKNKKIEKKNNIAEIFFIFFAFKDVSSILHFLQYEKKYKKSKMSSAKLRWEEK